MVVVMMKTSPLSSLNSTYSNAAIYWYQRQSLQQKKGLDSMKSNYKYTVHFYVTVYTSFKLLV